MQKVVFRLSRFAQSEKDGQGKAWPPREKKFVRNPSKNEIQDRKYTKDDKQIHDLKPEHEGFFL